MLKICALLILLLLPAALPADAQAELVIAYLDVGQGDSTIIKMPNGKTMLIDGGERIETPTILDMADSLSIERFDVVVATHPHADHIGGLVDLFYEFPVGRVLDSGQQHTTKTFEDYLAAIEENKIPYAMARDGDAIDLDPTVDIQVLNPAKNFPFAMHDPDNFNNNSVVITLKYGEFSAIFPGDIEAATEDLLSNRDIDVDVLLASHHGSNTSSTPAYLKAALPEVVIIYAGQDNIYGYPHREVLQRIDALGPLLFRTDVDGHVMLYANQTHYEIETLGSNKSVVIPEFQNLLIVSVLPIAAVIILWRYAKWKL